MVWDARLYGEPASRSAAHDVAIVQQNEFRSLRGHARLAWAGKSFPPPCSGFSACEQQQGIGLPDAQTAPAARCRIADIHDEVVDRFDLVKPMTRVRFGAHAPNELGTSETAQCLYEVACETAYINFDTLRQKSERAGAVAGAPSRLRELEPVNREARNAQHRLRVLTEDSMEGFAGNTGELGVAQRSHVCGALAARNQPHLTNDIAGGNAPHEPAPVAVVRREDTQASAQNNIQRVGGLSCGEQG